MGNPTANTLTGKIKRITHNPTATLATVELDPNVPQEITISYVPVPGPKGGPGTGTEGQGALQPNVATSLAQGDDVTVLVPVPNAVIMKGI